MNLSIREWRIGDKTALAQNLNNPKVLNNLRDGLPLSVHGERCRGYYERSVDNNRCTK